MAKATFEITINGVDKVKEIVKRVMDEAEFKETVSEEYKNGFYDFGNAVIHMLEATEKKWGQTNE